MSLSTIQVDLLDEISRLSFFGRPVFQLGDVLGWMKNVPTPHPNTSGVEILSAKSLSFDYQSDTSPINIGLKSIWIPLVQEILTVSLDGRPGQEPPFEMALKQVPCWQKITHIDLARDPMHMSTRLNFRLRTAEVPVEHHETIFDHDDFRPL